MTKIISFSLWGDNPKYTNGAVKNAIIAQDLFPDWTCRFYVADDVPEHITNKLIDLGNSEIVNMYGTGWNGMFWRFLAADSDDTVIVRDTDSRLGTREKAAVEAWLASNKDFHIMRDHPYHAIEILGGMWGVKNGLLKGVLIPEMEKWDKGEYDDQYQVDQKFLREVVYTMVRGKAMVHDEFFEKMPFPPESTPRSPHYFVGQVYNHKDEPEF